MGDEDERSVADLFADQMEFANVLLVNKTDLVSADGKRELLATLPPLNPTAKVIDIERDRLCARTTTFLSCIRSFHEIPRRPSSKKQFPRISQSAPKIPCTVAAFMANPGNSPIQLVDRHYVFAIGHRCLRQQKFS